MLRFLAGLLVGACLGIASSGYAVTFVGKSSELQGWVVTVWGEEACKNPFVDIEAREIACE